MLFLKKGIEKAKDSWIYPHPGQSNTGNCAAYTGAACLYAFGLDHEPSLIPAFGSGSDGEKFISRITKMIERLTDLIYRKDASPADGYRKYIDEVGLHCKFDVTEVPLKKTDYDPLAGATVEMSNLPYIIEQMKRCQDIMLHIKWGQGWFDRGGHRHSVGLVGIDEGTGELILSNPWGTSHLNPDDAASNTNSGTGDRFTRHKYRVDGDGNTIIPFDGHDVTIYECIMICPADPHMVAVNGQAEPVPHRTAPIPAEPQRVAETRRYRYTVGNTIADGVNGFAVALPGLAPHNILTIKTPKGWTAAPWYRERERFDQPAPEASVEPDRLTFMGIVWRSKQVLTRGQTRDGFALTLDLPPADPGRPWEDDPYGHVVVFFEQGASFTAWHMGAPGPRRRELLTQPHLDQPPAPRG